MTMHLLMNLLTVLLTWTLLSNISDSSGNNVDDNSSSDDDDSGSGNVANTIDPTTIATSTTTRKPDHPVRIPGTSELRDFVKNRTKS